MSNSQFAFTGLLDIQIHGGHSIVDHSLIGKQSLYCSVGCGDEKFKTKTQENAGKAAVWEQSFIFNLNVQQYHKEQDLVHFKVKVPHLVSGATKVGIAALKLSELYKVQNVRHSIQLVSEHNFHEKRGILDITVQFKPAVGSVVTAAPAVAPPPSIYTAAPAVASPSIYTAVPAVPMIAPVYPALSASTFVPVGYVPYVSVQPAASVPAEALLAQPSLAKEPMCLLDITGSMNFPVSEHSGLSRMHVLRNALFSVVEVLAQEDAQAEREQKEADASDDEEAGGLRTITFAGGHATDIGDLNPSNVHSKLDKIHPAGNTQIVPAYRKMWQVYNEEFGDKPKHLQPVILALVLTDGEALDTDEFVQALEDVHGKIFVKVVLCGYGSELHSALRAYQGVAAHNSNVSVTSISGETSGTLIAKQLLALLEK